MLSTSHPHESSPQAYVVRTVMSTPGITRDGQILSPLANVLQVWMAELDASPAWVTRSPQSFLSTPLNFLLPASKETTRSPSSSEVTCGRLPRCMCFHNVRLTLDLGLEVPVGLHHVSWSQLNAAQQMEVLTTRFVNAQYFVRSLTRSIKVCHGSYFPLSLRPHF